MVDKLNDNKKLEDQQILIKASEALSKMKCGAIIDINDIDNLIKSVVIAKEKIL
jgi:hypothetical protein